MAGAIGVRVVPMRNYISIKYIALACLCCVVCVAALLRSRSPKIDIDASEHLRRGMTEDEVATVLGGPAGDYTSNGYKVFYLSVSGLHQVPPANDSGADDPRSRYTKDWISDEGVISVTFDGQGRATDFLPGVASLYDSWTEKLVDHCRSLLGW